MLPATGKTGFTAPALNLVMTLVTLPILVLTAHISPTASGQTTFQAPLHQMVPSDRGALAVVPGDVDKDGDMDIIIASTASDGSAGSPSLYINRGDAFFRDATDARFPPSSNAGNTTSIALGDLDADGDIDLVIGRGSHNTPDQDLLWLNDGTGNFDDDTAARLPILFDHTASVVLGDVDADGDLDLVTGNGADVVGGERNRLYLNDGTGRFQDATDLNLPPVSDRTSEVVLFDVDLDGDLDLMVGNKMWQNRLYLNDGHGLYTDATTTNMPHDAAHTFSITVGDIDGDGDQDAVFGNADSGSGHHGSTNLVYLNDGTGTFIDATSISLPPDADPTWDVALVDIDLDGDLDIFAGNDSRLAPPLEQHDHLYLNDGKGVFTRAPVEYLPPHSGSTHDVAITDFDGDLDPDTFLGNGGSQDRLYLNDSNGHLTDVTGLVLPVNYQFTKALIVRDLDGDGDLDIYEGNCAQQDRLYLSDGEGSFADATTPNLPEIDDLTSSLSAGDVDGDGDLDILAGNGDLYTLQQNRLFLNDGHGVFSDATALRLPAWTDQTTAVCLGDVDRDGDLDLYVGNYYGDRLYLNDGTGSFMDVTGTNLPGGYEDYTGDVALGDVDGDGDLDVLRATGIPWRLSFHNSLYLNDGTGVFTDVTQDHIVGEVAHATSAVCVGDVDGDGDLDAFFGNQTDGAFFPVSDDLFLNDGFGFFTAASDRLPDEIGLTTSAALGDLDGDGDLDISVGDERARNRIFLNDGAGIFQDSTEDNVPSGANSTYCVILADIDGDADLDSLVGNRGENEILSGLVRHLAWHEQPRLGHWLNLDLYGKPADAWILLASTRSGDISTPFGRFRLDPGFLMNLGSGVLDSEGRAVKTFWVAPDPAFEGFDLYWQALLVGFPPAWTNMEITTFEDL